MPRGRQQPTVRTLTRHQGRHRDSSPPPQVVIGHLVRAAGLIHDRGDPIGRDPVTDHGTVAESREFELPIATLLTRAPMHEIRPPDQGADQGEERQDLHRR